MLRTIIASALMAASEALAHAALRIQPKPMLRAVIVEAFFVAAIVACSMMPTIEPAKVRAIMAMRGHFLSKAQRDAVDVWLAERAIEGKG